MERNHTERLRYSAQIRLPEFGKEGQKRLAGASVLIVGCGALGSVVASYLAGAGVGKLTLADFDTIEISNLQRQVFFSEEEAGHLKAESMAKTIGNLNSDVDVEVWPVPVTSKFLKENDFHADVIVDAADNPATTYLLESYCCDHDIPLSTAGVSGWKAQIMTCVPGGVRFSDIFPPAETAEAILPCAIAGVFGPLTGIVGALQASETIKVILKKGEILDNSLLTIDLLNNTFTKIGI